MSGQNTSSPLADIPHHSWNALATKRIYFGHQSVGYDILAGVTDLLKPSPQTTLRLIDSADPTALDQPGIVHSKLGSNTDPDSKLQAFTNFLAAGAGERADLALMKLCYVDIEHQTDPVALFDRYAKAFAILEARYPRVTFLHATAPLTARPSGIKSALKTALGKPLWGDEQNKRRHQFNELLRQHTRGTSRLFDLARFESTSPDGTPHTFTYAGTSSPCLYPPYTTDGGHLNAQGRAMLAREFLRFLAGAIA